MRELPDEVAVRVPVDCAPEDLAAEIARLLADADRRRQMRAAALDFAACHTPAEQARRIVEAISRSTGVGG